MFNIDGVLELQDDHQITQASYPSKQMSLILYEQANKITCSYEIMKNENIFK